MTEDEGAARRPRRDFGIGSVAGFEIRVDFSWFVIFFLVFWSLSGGVFPQEYPDLSPRAHTLMGLAGTLLFFASLVLHELSHALVSRAKGIEVEGITLFVFGGIARASREPESPRDEVLIAGVGPLTSLILAAFFWGAGRVAAALGLGDPVVGVTSYLAYINVALAVFNVMPGFPLDGGRVFRALVWSATGDREKATRVATGGGRLFGLLLIALGVLQLFAGAAVSGLWLVFIGWFLRTLAGASLRQEVLQGILEGHVAAEIMTADPVVVPSDVTVEALVHRHFLHLRYGAYPVVGDRGVVGLVTLDDVKRFPRDVWGVSTAADAMTPLDRCAVVSPETPVAEVLQTMSRSGERRRALVVREDALVGIISATDVARWIDRARDVQDLMGRAPRKGDGS